MTVARVHFLCLNVGDKNNDYNAQLYYLRKKGGYVVCNFDKLVCPSCNVPMTVRDSRKRLVKDSAGKIYNFSLRRLKCPQCGCIHLELPDCIEPNKRYFKLTIKNTLSNDIDFCVADDSTIRRWRK